MVQWNFLPWVHMDTTSYVFHARGSGSNPGRRVHKQTNDLTRATHCRTQISTTHAGNEFDFTVFVN